jgi:hypothetical protein
MRTDSAAIFTEEFFRAAGAAFGKTSTWEELDGGGRARPCAILLDEFGALTPAVAAEFVPKLCWLTEQAGSQVRAIVSLPEPDGPAGASPLQAFLKAHGLEHPKYWRQWRSVRVPPFGPGELDALLSLLPRWAGDLACAHRATILELSCGNPRRLQCLCSRLFEAAQRGAVGGELAGLVCGRENYE